MTPQMQLAMRVLSLGQLELSDLIQEKIEENPMLEHLDEEASRADETSPEISLQDAPEAEPSTDIAASEAWADDHNIDRAIEERDFNVLNDSASPMTVSYENFATTEQTRAEALQDQLRDILSDAAVRSVAFDLVYWLDEDGYLRESDTEIAASMSVDITQVAHARAGLQACMPRGLAARSLAECFRLQLDTIDPKLDKLLDHLPDLAKGSLEMITAQTGLNASDIKQAVGQLKSLDPHPGRDFIAATDLAAPPDVLFRRNAQGQWYAEINESFLPALHVREGLWEDLARRDQDETLKNYISQNRQAARWLQRTIFTRAMSLLRVSEAIISEQEAFLNKGIAHLRPMTIREIADRVGLNEGTVSRVVANKLIATPLGVWPMKKLFSSAVGQSSGDDGVSSTAVKQRIKALIDQEPADNPLSDAKLVELISSAGVPIARRTVTKYREALGLGSSVERRRQKQFS